MWILLLPGPDDHHFVFTALTHEPVTTWHRQRCLFAHADCRMASAELADLLPVGNAAGRLAVDILPVHLRAGTLQRVRAGGAERAR